MLGPGGHPQRDAIGDLDGINGLDLAVANSASDRVSVLLNNGNGTFPQNNNPMYSVGTRPLSVAIGDLNGDGILDLAVANGDSHNVSVRLGLPQTP